jgi:sec-independent protein translocase protein TatC
MPRRPEVDEKLPFTEHLAELRVRLLYASLAIAAAFAVCFWQSATLAGVLLAPLTDALAPGSPVVFTRLTEPFWTYMKLSLYVALFLASPVWLTQLWAFVAPGLYENERRAVLPIVGLSVLAFLAGGAFCYFIAFPTMFRFFLSFETDYLIASPSIAEYLDLTSKLVLAFGLAFEYPVAVLILARTGAVTAAGLRKSRSYATIIIFVIAMMVTPPDWLSQLLFAVPMLVLYEVGIWVAAATGRKRPARPAAEPAASPHAAWSPPDAPDENGNEPG